MLIIFTCVIKQTCNEGAVSEDSVYGGDVLKVALLKHRVFKQHGFHLQVDESGKQVVYIFRFWFKKIQYSSILVTYY